MSSGDGPARGPTTSAMPWWPSNPATDVSVPPSTSTTGIRRLVACSTSFSSAWRRCGTTSRRRASRRATNASSTGRRPATISSSSAERQRRRERLGRPRRRTRAAVVPRVGPGRRPKRTVDRAVVRTVGSTGAWPGRYVPGPEGRAGRTGPVRGRSGAEGARRSGTERARRPRSEAGRARRRRRAGLGGRRAGPGDRRRADHDGRRAGPGGGRAVDGGRRAGPGGRRRPGRKPPARGRSRSRGYPEGVPRNGGRPPPVASRRGRSSSGPRRSSSRGRRSSSQGLGARDPGRPPVGLRPRESGRSARCGRSARAWRSGPGPRWSASGSARNPNPGRSPSGGWLGRSPLDGGRAREPPRAGLAPRPLGGRLGAASAPRSPPPGALDCAAWPAASVGPSSRFDRRFGFGSPSSAGGRSATGGHQEAPALAVARVLDRDPAREQLVAEAVRLRPVAARARRGARVEHRLELGVERRARPARPRRAPHRGRGSAPRPRAGVGRGQRARVDPPVELADPVEQGAQRGRDVEVVVEPRLEAGPDRVQRRRAASGRRPDPRGTRRGRRARRRSARSRPPRPASDSSEKLSGAR